MINKKEESYNNVFNEIKMYLNYEPKQIIIDFEKALYNAVRNIFKTSLISGCNFHLNKILWRRIQAEGLVLEYKNNSLVRFLIKKLYFLAFIPPIEVKRVFELLKNESAGLSDNKINSILSYFEKQFIGLVDDFSEDGVYEISFWSC